MDMPKSEAVTIEMPGDDHYGIVREWAEYVEGTEMSRLYRQERHIHKVPRLLLKGESGRRNKEYYEPAIVSLGPYHHYRSDLHEGEKYKVITLEEYISSSEQTMDFLYAKVFEVKDAARKCYIGDSTNKYDDKQFTLMMLRDACFILFFIECILSRNKKAMLNNEYLGALGFANVIRDIFLLENQIPFVVLQVLMTSRFHDKGERILNGFFNYLNYGEVIYRNEKVLGNDNCKQPLHLLELYREYFISISRSSIYSGPAPSSRWQGSIKKNDGDETYNYIKRNRSFSSVIELKAKGIFCKLTDIKSLEDIKFHSRYCYGELELVRRAVYPNSKPIYLNMIAYEMCPHNPNDFRVSTYIRVMKSLIVHPDDVKELRSKNILLHSLGRDEEVVRMFEEIGTPAVNLYMFNQLRKGIEKHCNNKYKTWMAELITVYFRSPWQTVAIMVAAAILFCSFLQTYFAIRPVRDDLNQDMIKLLAKCIHTKPH